MPFFGANSYWFWSYSQTEVATTVPGSVVGLIFIPTISPEAGHAAASVNVKTKLVSTAEQLTVIASAAIALTFVVPFDAE